MRPRFFQRDFHGPATDKPGQDLLRCLVQVGRQQGLWLKTLVGIANEHPAEGHGRLAGVIPHGAYRWPLLPRGGRRHTTAQW